MLAAAATKLGIDLDQTIEIGFQDHQLSIRHRIDSANLAINLLIKKIGLFGKVFGLTLEIGFRLSTGNKSQGQHNKRNKSQ